jgi:uncharacterized repeat protein (TIGR01451 family)
VIQTSSKRFSRVGKRTGSQVLALTTVLAGLAIMATAGGAQAANAVPTVDLAIVSKTADVTKAHPGQLVTYTIVATNYGPDIAQSLDVTDLVDLQNSGLQMVDMSCDQGISADTPSCEYTSVAPGQTVTTIVTVRVLKHSKSKVVTNEACVSAENEVIDADASNDCLTVTLPLRGKKL